MIKTNKEFRTTIGNQEGFTIIELMIATVVFSTVLLIATISIIFVSKTYSTSQINIKLQNTTESILTSLSNAIKYNKPTPISMNYSAAFGNYSGYFCIGDNVYTYYLPSRSGDNQPLNYADSAGNIKNKIGLIQSVSTNCGPNINGVQLLSNNERLGELDIVPRGNSYEILISVAYGDDSVLKLPTTAFPPNSDSTPNYPYYCDVNSFSLSFCSVDSVSTVASSRLNQ